MRLRVRKLVCRLGIHQRRWRQYYGIDTCLVCGKSIPWKWFK